jgi:hypothetical protein
MNWLERRERRGLGKDAAERVSAGCYGSLVAASTLAGQHGHRSSPTLGDAIASPLGTECVQVPAMA